MQSKFAIVAPDKMEATLTMTAPIGDWRELAKQIREGKTVESAGYTVWPSCTFATLVEEVVSQAEKVFVSRASDTKEGSP